MGTASGKLKEVYALVEEGVRPGHGSIRPGADGRKIHRDILALFDARGFNTGRKAGRMQGFFHGTVRGRGHPRWMPPDVAQICIAFSVALTNVSTSGGDEVKWTTKVAPAGGSASRTFP